MKYCPYCNNVLNDNDTFCNNCGNAVSNNQPQVYNNPYPQQNNTTADFMKMNVNTQISNTKTLAIVTLIGAFIFPPVWLICGIIACVKGNDVVKAANQTGDMNLINEANKVKKFAVIAFVVPAALVFFAITFIYTLIIMGPKIKALFGQSDSYYDGQMIINAFNYLLFKFNIVL